MVLVRFPARMDASGQVKDPPRDKYLPFSQVNTPAVRALGVQLLSEIDAGLAPDPHKSAAQVEADRLRQENLDLQKRLAELEKGAKKETKVKADAGQA